MGSSLKTYRDMTVKLLFIKQSLEDNELLETITVDILKKG